MSSRSSRCADGQDASFVYDADGNLTHQTDGNHHTTAYTYSPLNQLSSVTDPLGRVTRYSYDLAGNHTTRTDPRGITAAHMPTTRRPPGDHRILQRQHPGRVPSSTPSTGKRATMTDGTGTTSTTYDALDPADPAGRTAAQQSEDRLRLRPAGLLQICPAPTPNGKTVTRSPTTSTAGCPR